MAHDRENRDIVEEQRENEQQVRLREQDAENEPVIDSGKERLDVLFEENEREQFHTHWMNIQSKFVDNPRESVREADELVADVLKSVTMNFHERRTSLEKQWNNGNNVSTEDLRMALKRYRSFFERLLTLES